MNTASFTRTVISIRGGLLSTVMILLASNFNLQCGKNSRYYMAIAFARVGMPCCFVRGLLRMRLNMQNLHNFCHSTKDVLVNVIIPLPAEWPMLYVPPARVGYYEAIDALTVARRLLKLTKLAPNIVHRLIKPIINLPHCFYQIMTGGLRKWSHYLKWR